MKSVINDGTSTKVIYNTFDAGRALTLIDKATEGKLTAYVSGPSGTLARISNTVNSQNGSLGPDDITYIHADHLGTGRVGTDASGAVKWEDYHTPFGESLIHPDATDDQGDFTGHIRDSGSGLTYMQARYYDPIAGRFLSIDPVTFMDTGNPAMFNRYAYTENDPVNFTDPTGQFRCSGDSEGCAAVDAAATQAQAAITKAAERLSSLSSALESEADLSTDQSNLLDTITNNFGEENASVNGISKIQDRLGELSERIGEPGTGAKVKVKPGDVSWSGAEAETGRFTGDIRVYQKAFRATVENANIDLVGIVIHEAGHTNGWSLDDGYGQGDATRYGQKYPGRAVKHYPNSSTCFLTGGRCGGK